MELRSHKNSSVKIVQNENKFKECILGMCLILHIKMVVVEVPLNQPVADFLIVFTDNLLKAALLG